MMVVKVKGSCDDAEERDSGVDGFDVGVVGVGDGIDGVDGVDGVDVVDVDVKGEGGTGRRAG